MGSTPPPPPPDSTIFPLSWRVGGNIGIDIIKIRDSRFQIQFFMSYITKRSRFTYFGIHSLLTLYICFCLFWRELSP